MMNWIISPPMQQRADLVPVQNASFKTRENLYSNFFFLSSPIITVWKSSCLTKKFPCCDFETYLLMAEVWTHPPQSMSWQARWAVSVHGPHQLHQGKERKILFTSLEIFLQCFTSCAGLTSSSPQKAKGISSNPRAEFGFLFHLDWCLILFFLFNIMDSIVWYGRGVYRPKHPLRVHHLLLSSKVIIEEWFRSKETFKNHVVQIPWLPKFDVHSIITINVNKYS